MRQREILALVVVVALLVVGALVYYGVSSGFETTPLERTQEQNSGVNAPLEQAPSPGTVEDESGDPQLPQQQQ